MDERKIITENENQHKKDSWKNVLNDSEKNINSILPELVANSEIKELVDWYKKQADKLPKFESSEASLTDGQWKADIIVPSGRDERINAADKILDGLDPELPVKKIGRSDGLFYQVVGQTNNKGGFEWTQPVVAARETEMEVKVYNKERHLPINGILAIFADSEGKILMTVDQETTAETQNHAVIRLPVQASAGKIKMMKEGKTEADKNLANFLKIYNDGQIENLLDSAQAILPIPPEDLNLMIKHNLLLIMPPIDVGNELHSKLTSDGSRMWLSKKQMAAANVLNLTNGHTASAINLAEAYKYLSSTS